MTDKKITKEHYQTHTITEVEHIPEHDAREDTLEFRNSKKELENVEHLGCYICGSIEKRESHHVFERCYWNGYDLKKIVCLLFNHFDFHGHCKRDFKDENGLFDHWVKEYNGHEVVLLNGSKYWTCDDTAADEIYNQLILDFFHHRGLGTSAHGATAATFMAWMAHRDGYQISMSLEDYGKLPHK